MEATGGSTQLTGASGACRAGILSALALTLLVYARILFGIIVHPLRLGHDQALHLFIGSELLEGRLPFVWHYDTNPPLIYYIDTIPALFAKLCHLHVITSFQIFILLLAVISSALSMRFIWSYAKECEKIPLSWSVLGLACFSAKLFLDFGQREHIFVLAVFPFILLRWWRWTGTKPAKVDALIAGAFAAFGIALKHYFLVPPLLFELFWIVRLATVRPLLATEWLTTLALMLLYAIHFFFLPPAMRENYFSLVVPLLIGGYGWFDKNLVSMLSMPLRKPVVISVPILCAVALCFYRRTTLVISVVTFAFGTLFVFFLQHKGWSYQLQPAWAVVSILCGLVLGLCLQTAKKHAPQITDILFCLAPIVVIFFMTINGMKDYDAASAAVKIRRSYDNYEVSIPAKDTGPLGYLLNENTVPGDQIILLGAGGPEFPVCLQLGLGQGARFSDDVCLAMCESLRLQAATSDLGVKLLDQVFKMYNEDIPKRKPKLILLQAHTRSWLARYQIEQTLLRDYERIAEDKMEVSVRKRMAEDKIEVYVRKDNQ